MNLVEFLPYIRYLMAASDNRRKIHTVTLRKYYVTCHYANTMLLWKYYEYVTTKVFKIAIRKNNQ